MIADYFSKERETSSSNKTLEEDADEYVNSIILDAGSVTEKKIREYSTRDKLIMEIKKSLSTGNWDPCMKNFENMKDKITEVNGVILRGHRILIPGELVLTVFNTNQEGHPGVCLTKRRIRERYYWESLDKDIEKFVGGCHGC